MTPTRATIVCAVLFVLVLSQSIAKAQQATAVSGAVLDPLGARVTDAAVTLVGERGETAQTTSGDAGVYAFDDVPAGRYQIVVRATGFEPYTSDPRFAGPGSHVIIDAHLHIGALEQSVVVTASALDTPQSQTGAPVTVIDHATLGALNKRDLFEALRLVPGAQIVQTGAKGGATSLFIRGGNSNFNKVLFDGIPINDIGGGFDFAQLTTSGVDRVEVLRQTNSVMYGSDALAGVVNITSRRGRARIPGLEYSLDGGNLGTVSTAAAVGGAVGRFDYFSTYSYLETDNHVPNNGYRNGTYVGRFGLALGRSTDVSGSVLGIDTTFGSPNGILLYNIPDDASQTRDQIYVTADARTFWTDRWQSAVRVGWTDERFEYLNPAPTGTPFDPFGFGVNYLGDMVTLKAADGKTVSGRAILEFGGTPYPAISESRTSRRLIAGDTTYELSRDLSVAAGGRYEREEGFDDPDGPATVVRHNVGMFVEARGTLSNRHYISVGLGYEHHAVFESAVTPRLSIASYLRTPRATGVGDTKLVLNLGTGIKAPSVFQEQNALLELLEGTGISVAPVGPERSRTFDVGLEQGFWDGRARARLSYFHNTFSDLLEYLSPAALVGIGVPPDVAEASGFGAYVNAASFRAQGLEASAEVAVNQRLRIVASYTYLDARVTETFGATESFNPLFPDIPIGAFSALVGERPFRRPTNAATLLAMYNHGPAQLAVAGYFSGKTDDSTGLTDAFFGNSLLLPNQDLVPAYQKVDVSGSYRIQSRLRGYVTIENLFDQDYQPAFGFPALPLTARVGFRLTLGGD